jgi:uncharacterized protein with von Willebrand factor type A (vWA) domain
VDSARIALAQRALLALNDANKSDVCAALEATLVSRQQDRALFAEAFAAFFKDPALAQKLLSQMLPAVGEKGPAPKQRARLREALAPQKGFAQNTKPAAPEQKLEFDMAMTASDAQRLKHADFNNLSGAEYALVMRIAQTIGLELPKYLSRRHALGTRGHALAWGPTLARAAHTLGEPLQLLRKRRKPQALPVLMLVDVSGSMERYTRLLLAYLHAATQGAQRSVFSFGHTLTDLTPAFKLREPDAMLAAANRAIQDFAGGTQLGAALAQLRTQHRRRLVGKRTLVLLVSDGLDTGEPGALQEELHWLKRHSGPLVWLNPLMRFEAYTPTARAAAVLHKAANAMLAVHNLESLQQLAQGLAQVVGKLGDSR